MRCIFCKKNSDDSKSIEHIIPESLGNLEHVLPKGIVCDKCNNYFANKIERPLLDSRYFLQVRSRLAIPTKKGKFRSREIFHQETGAILEIVHYEGEWVVYGISDEDERKFIHNLQTIGKGTFVELHLNKPDVEDKYLVSRFLGKVALEVVAQHALEVDGGLDEIIDKAELDELRHYVRQGNPKVIWPYHERAIYPETGCFQENGQPYEILHEYILLYTDEQELYLVLAIFGIEYALNLGGPELEGYIKWLRSNEEKSPLYF